MPAAEAARILARHGRSFHWASAFLSERHGRDAATLYAFCRHADDLVDERPPAEGAAAIAALIARVSAAPATGPDASASTVATPRSEAGGPVVEAFLDLLRRRHIDIAVVTALLRTLQQDAGMVRLRDTDELLRYGYGVASTVGLMMCAVLDCDDPRARAFAIDLGIAMQLTNVARDVLEDAGRNRIYVPLPASVQPADLLRGPGPARDRALTAVHEVLALAHRYYRSADRGLCYLPLRARAAILAAGRIYEGIGAVITRRGNAYWQQRCHVGTAGKLWHTLRATASLCCHPGYWRRARGARHDAELHAPLRGLPGVDTA